MEVRDRTRTEPSTQSAGSTRWMLALIGLPTGAALVVYFIASVSLALGFVVCGAVATTAFGFAWRRLDTSARLVWSRRLRAGLAAGAVATVAYDVSRFALKAAFSLDIEPWVALPLFGQLVTGFDAATGVAITAGFFYHVANGVGFGVAYTLVAGKRGPVAGVIFALALEAAMLTFYPGWLDIRSRAEFVSVTMLGHVAYGAVLGWSARRLIGGARGR